MRLISLRKSFCWAGLFCVTALLLSLLPTPAFAGLYSATAVPLTGAATASSYLDEMWWNPETEIEEQRVWAVDNLNDGVWAPDETSTWDDCTWIAANGEANSWVNIALDFPAEVAQVSYQTPFGNRWLANCELAVKTVGATEYTPVLQWVNSTTTINGISIDPIENVTDVKLSFSDSPLEYYDPIAVSEIAIYSPSNIDVIEVGGAMQTGATEGEVNLALAGVGIAQDSLTPDYAQDRLNDGQPYDAANAWIAASLDPSWAGVILAEAADIDRIAFGNRSGYPGRSAGTYAIEYTTADMASIDPTDPTAIDALTWLQIGETLRTDDTILERQLLQFDTVEDATAVRIIVDSEVAEIALAEIEVYAALPDEKIPGDANKDGKVDGSDVTILAGNWQRGVTPPADATWEMGDFNEDGKVDGSDVTILAGNWQYGVTAAASAVPEPGTLCLLASLVVGAFCFTHSRKGAKSMLSRIRLLSVFALAVICLGSTVASAQVSRTLHGDMYYYDATLNVATAGTPYASESRAGIDDTYLPEALTDGIAGLSGSTAWTSIPWSGGTYIPTPVEHLGKDYYFGVTLDSPKSINKVAWTAGWHDWGLGSYELQYQTQGSTEWTTLSTHLDYTTSWFEYEFPTISNVTDIRVNTYGVAEARIGISAQELMVFEDVTSTQVPVQIVAQQNFADPEDPNAVQDWTTNLAYWENGGVSFASSILNTAYSVPQLNDGYHSGEANSFILSTAESVGDHPSGFCGIALPSASTIDRIAFGSQVGYNMRSAGNYTLQYTTDSLDSAASELAVMAGPVSGITEQTVADAGDAMDALTWNTITTFNYDEPYTSVLPRSVFQFDPLSDVTAIRVIMESGYNEMSIVELEVYAPEIPSAAASVVPEPSMMVLLGLLLATAGILRFRQR